MGAREWVPRSLAGMAQAFYGTVGIGGATALLTMVSGSLFARLGSAGFWGMAFLSSAALPISRNRAAAWAHVCAVSPGMHAHHC
jgi:hypothetical protein